MNALRVSPHPASYTSTRRFADSAHIGGMERLLQAVQELSLARSLPEIQRVVRASARELTGCDGATLVLCDNGAGWSMHCGVSTSQTTGPTGFLSASASWWRPQPRPRPWTPCWHAQTS